LDFSSIASSSSDNLSSSFTAGSSLSFDAAACFFDDPGPLTFRFVVVFFFVSLSSFCSEISEINFFLENQNDVSALPFSFSA